MNKECAHEDMEYDGCGDGYIDYRCKDCGWVEFQFEDCPGGR